MLTPAHFLDRSRFLVDWTSQADWRLWHAKLPLYRLCWALSRLWFSYPPTFSACRPYCLHVHITWPIGSLAWWMTLWHQTG